MNYAIFAVALWAVFFAIGTLQLREKRSFLQKAALIRVFSLLGFICMFFVLIVILAIGVLM